ncbi:hypothetical protein [Rhodococcus gannanensis]|uniref:Uncharacterized protein n=1 Tax=Rhodococcus gannanensis TaxID=1960308 RepID=A0ABW4PBA6_9NOCA
MDTPTPSSDQSPPPPDPDAVSLAPGDDLHERPENTHLILYLAAFALFVGLTVWGLVAYQHSENDDQAREKAIELAVLFSASDLKSPDIDATARVLGTDGGAACADDGSALRESLFHQQIVNGAAGPGQRPILVARNLLEGERLVLTVYCPDRLPEFDAWVDGLKLEAGE